MIFFLLSIQVEKYSDQLFFTFLTFHTGRAHGTENVLLLTDKFLSISNSFHDTKLRITKFLNFDHIIHKECVITPTWVNGFS